MCLLDPQGRIITWNEGARRIKGYQAQEVLGKPISIFYTSEDREHGKPAQVLRMAAEHGSFEDEGWRVRKDGSRFWADVVVTALRDDDGHLIGFAKITRDLTERKRAEEALRASEERYRTLVEMAPDVIFSIAAPEGTFTSLSPAFEAITGWSVSEWLGQPFTGIIHPDDRYRALEIFERILR